MRGTVFCGSSDFPSPKAPNIHPLEQVAKRFDVVEIGTSFEQHLKPELTRLWIRKTAANPNFLFTAKLHRAFTHDRLLDGGEIKAFKEGLLPLLRARKFGCLLMQFPWSFRYTAENRAHLLKLRRTFSEFPLAAEMRHVSWSLDEAIGTFIDYRIGFCNIDQPAYTKAMPPASFLTSSIGYVRLHGRNCFNWYGAADRASRQPRYDYVYSDDEIASWLRRIDHLRGYADKVFVVANNGAGGKAIATASRIKSLLRGELVERQRATIQKPLFTEYHAA